MIIMHEDNTFWEVTPVLLWHWKKKQRKDEVDCNHRFNKSQYNNRRSSLSLSSSEITMFSTIKQTNKFVQQSSVLRSFSHQQIRWYSTPSMCVAVSVLFMYILSVIHSVLLTRIYMYMCQWMGKKTKCSTHTYTYTM